MWLLHNLDPAEFIGKYWQKKPCLIRGAFPDCTSPISAEELAGLACEDGINCRLVVERGGQIPWQVRYGPFKEDDFTSLPASHYSLLVSECEKWIPELNELLDQFNFIPRWRIDDLMVSYAPEHGSVGAHIDQYDVFLLQVEGQRCWSYDNSPTENPKLIEGLELAILESFHPEQEAVLQPGDMLYLPPGVAHHGIALEPGLTYSIGFRAPTVLSALESFVLEIDQDNAANQRYHDPDLEIGRHAYAITDREINRFRELALNLLEQSSHSWQDAIGKMLTDSSVSLTTSAEAPFDASNLLKDGWIKHPDTRILFHQAESEIRVYCNGRSHHLPNQTEIIECLHQLCSQREWSIELIHDCIAIDSIKKLILALAAESAIVPRSEFEDSDTTFD